MDLTYHKSRANLAILTETTPGTWMTSALVFLAENCKVPVKNMKLKISNKSVDRFLDRNSLLPIDSLFYGENAELSFDVDFYTSGTAGTDTSMAPILKSVMKAVDVANTSVTYSINSSSTVTTSIGIEFISEDGASSQRYGIKGCRVSKLELEGTVGAHGVWHVTIKGAFAYEDSAVVAQIAATPISGIIRDTLNSNIPQFKGIAFSTAGVHRLISKFTLDFGVTVEEETDVLDPTTIQRYVLTAVKPTLNIDPQLTPADTIKSFNEFFSGTTNALTFAFGEGAGKTATFTIARAQRKTADLGERGSFRTIETAYQLLGVTDDGDDAISISYT